MPTALGTEEERLFLPGAGRELLKKGPNKQSLEEGNNERSLVGGKWSEEKEYSKTIYR